MYQKIITTVILTMLIPLIGFAQWNYNFNGKWTLLHEKSSEIGLYNMLSIDFKQEGQNVTIIQKWGTSRSFSDTLRLKTDGKFSNFPIPDRVFRPMYLWGFPCMLVIPEQSKQNGNRKINS